MEMEDFELKKCCSVIGYCHFSIKNNKPIVIDGFSLIRRNTHAYYTGPKVAVCRPASENKSNGCKTWLSGRKTWFVTAQVLFFFS